MAQVISFSQTKMSEKKKEKKKWIVARLIRKRIGRGKNEHFEGRAIFVGGLGPEISSGKGNDPSGRY